MLRTSKDDTTRQMRRDDKSGWWAEQVRVSAVSFGG